MTTFPIEAVETRAFTDQKPGTSGLRKKTKVFMQQHYTENFIQATLDSIPSGAEGATLVVGGDGRYYLKEAIQKIISISCGNKVSFSSYALLGGQLFFVNFARLLIGAFLLKKN